MIRLIRLCITLKLIWLTLVKVDALPPVSSESQHPSLSLMAGFLQDTLVLLKTKHVVMAMPKSVDSKTTTNALWTEGITMEFHLDEHEDETIRNGLSFALTTGSTVSSRLKETLWDRMFWGFLYNRHLLFREHLTMILMGAPDWVYAAAVQIMSRWVIGSADTLLLAPVGGEFKGKILCPKMQLGIRVAVVKTLPVNEMDNGRACRGLLQDMFLVEGGSYELRTVGCWWKGNLTMRKQLLPPLTSLKGATLKTCVVKGFNEVILVPKGDRMVMTGNLGNFLNMIQEKLDFNFTMIEVVGFGTKAENGSFNGAVGFIERTEMDFGSVTFSVIIERDEVLDYSEVFVVHNTRFLTKVPSLRVDQFLLFQIYSWKAWCVIGVFILTSSVLLGFFWETASLNKRNSGSFSQYFLKGLGTGLRAGINASSNHRPTSSAGRVLLVAFWLVMIILVAVYSGNLTAFLSIPRVSNPPESIRELLDMGWTLSISYGYSQYAKMKTSPIKEQQIAFENADFRQDRGVMPTEEYIEKLRKEDIGLLVTVMSVPPVMDNYAKRVGTAKVCIFKSASEALFVELGALGFPRNSPIKHLFDDKINWLRSADLKEAMEATCMKEDLRSEKLEPLGMVKFGGVMVLWACGLGLALVCFLLEILVHPLYK